MTGLALLMGLFLPVTTVVVPTPSFLAGPCAAGASYDPACDVDHDGDVDIFDIQLTAGHWNRSGTWSGGGDGWSLTGNAGTNSASNFLGTVDNQPLVIRVNGQQALLIRPPVDATAAPSIIAGQGVVQANARGAVIAGGGISGSLNFVTDSYGVIGGGVANLADNADGDQDNAQYATVGGGYQIAASGSYSTVGAGYSSPASGSASTVSGGTFNDTSGEGSTVGGGSFVWADTQDRDFTSNTPNQFLVRAGNGGTFRSDNVFWALLAINDIVLGQGVRAATDGTYAGYFEDDIFVAGQCTGCLLAYVAVNVGGEALAVGDLVAPAGLAEPLAGSGTAVLRVQQAEAGQGVVGVVTARADLHDAVATHEAATEQIAERAEGAIQPGDYLFIAVQGLAPVRIAAGEAVAPGQRLTVAGAGQARALRTVAVEGVIVDESAPTVGVVVDLPDPATGLAQVLVSLR